ncbi:MAG: hypothetical protein DRJ44_01835 [Thermoprotei archaeon]|mgnify:CR=1 FL=1|nr:MAG: hypothetical protein DRJ44_01835 [Thermoprotei archaeon]
MKIEAVLLDFWGTMVYPDISIEEYFRRRAKYLRNVLIRHGYEHGFNRVYKELLKAREVSDKIRKLTSREVTVLGEMVIFAEKLGIEANGDLLRDLSFAYMRPYYLFTKPAPDLVEFIKWIYERGLLLGLVSNTMYGRATRRVLKRIGLRKYFKAIALSDEIGFRKPHKKIFMYALRRLKVRAERSLMIGDEFCDIYGAKRIGLKAVQYIGFRNENIGLEDFKVKSFKEVKEYIETLSSA